MTRYRGVARALMVALAVIAAGSVASSTGRGAGPKQITGSSSAAGSPFAGVPPVSVYLLALDAHSKALLTSVAPSLRQWLPPSYMLHTVVPTRTKWINKARDGELNARTTAQDLIASYKAARGPGQVLLMAVTSRAIYDPTTPGLSFVFGYAWWYRPQFAAIFGTLPMHVFKPEREKARLTKFMLRYIGQIVCNQPRNSDPHSVLFTPVISTDDLDRMDASLPAVCRH